MSQVNVPTSDRSQYDRFGARIRQPHVPTAFDTIDRIAGNPEMLDESIPQSERMNRLVDTHADSDPDTLSREMQRYFPGVSSQQVRSQYSDTQRRRSNQQQLEAAQARHTEAEGGWERVARRAIPFASSIYGAYNTVQYTNAKRRLEAGTPKPEDFDYIAEYENRQKRAEKEDVLTMLGNGALHIPAILIEAWTGGAVVGRAATALGLASRAAAGTGAAVVEGLATATAPKLLSKAGIWATMKSAPAFAAHAAAVTSLMPSMYAERAAQNADENDMNLSPDKRSGMWSPKNLVPAHLMGTLQFGVMSLMGGLGREVFGKIGAKALGTAAGTGAESAAGTVGHYAGAATIGGPVGVLAQQVVDILGKGVGLQNNYGLMQMINEGKTDKAMSAALVQALTFSAFAAIHGGPRARGRFDNAPRVLETFAEARNAMRKSGLSEKAAGENLNAVSDMFAESVNENASTSNREVMERMMKEHQYPDVAGPELKAYAEALADTLAYPGQQGGPSGPSRLTAGPRPVPPPVPTPGSQVPFNQPAAQPSLTGSVPPGATATPPPVATPSPTAVPGTSPAGMPPVGTGPATQTSPRTASSPEQTAPIPSQRNLPPVTSIPAELRPPVDFVSRVAEAYKIAEGKPLDATATIGESVFGKSNIEPAEIADAVSKGWMKKNSDGTYTVNPSLIQLASQQQASPAPTAVPGSPPPQSSQAKSPTSSVTQSSSPGEFSINAELAKTTVQRIVEQLKAQFGLQVQPAMRSEISRRVTELSYRKFANAEEAKKAVNDLAQEFVPERFPPGPQTEASRTSDVSKLLSESTVPSPEFMEKLGDRAKGPIKKTSLNDFSNKEIADAKEKGWLTESEPGTFEVPATQFLAKIGNRITGQHRLLDFGNQEIREAIKANWLAEVKPGHYEITEPFRQSILGERPASVEPTPESLGLPEGTPGYKTAKGSVYELHEDGTTTRMKAGRDEKGHVGDFGLKPKSARTIFVDNELANEIPYTHLNAIAEGRLVIKGDKVIAQKEMKDGKVHHEEMPFSNKPEVGLSPVELWNNTNDVPGYETYRTRHLGNVITEIFPGKTATKASEPVASESSPAVEQPVAKSAKTKSPSERDAYAELANQKSKALEDFAKSKESFTFEQLQEGGASKTFANMWLQHQIVNGNIVPEGKNEYAWKRQAEQSTVVEKPAAEQPAVSAAVAEPPKTAIPVELGGKPPIQESPMFKAKPKDAVDVVRRELYRLQDAANEKGSGAASRIEESALRSALKERGVDGEVADKALASLKKLRQVEHHKDGTWQLHPDKFRDVFNTLSSEAGAVRELAEKGGEKSKALEDFAKSKESFTLKQLQEGKVSETAADIWLQHQIENGNIAKKGKTKYAWQRQAEATAPEVEAKTQLPPEKQGLKQKPSDAMREYAQEKYMFDRAEIENDMAEKGYSKEQVTDWLKQEEGKSIVKEISKSGKENWTLNDEASQEATAKNEALAAKKAKRAAEPDEGSPQKKLFDLSSRFNAEDTGLPELSRGGKLSTGLKVGWGELAARPGEQGIIGKWYEAASKWFSRLGDKAMTEEEARRYADQDNKMAMTNIEAGARELAGETYPKTGSIKKGLVDKGVVDPGEDVVNEAGRFISTNNHIQRLMPKLINDLTEGKYTLEGGKRMLTTLYEMRLQHTVNEAKRLIGLLEGESKDSTTSPARQESIKDSMKELQKYLTKNDGKTFVGAPGSVLRTSADYQSQLSDPAFLKFRQVWQDKIAPMLEEFTQKGRGLDDSSEIESWTQMKNEAEGLNLVFHYITAKEGEGGVKPGRPGQVQSPSVADVAESPDHVHTGIGGETRGGFNKHKANEQAYSGKLTMLAKEGYQTNLEKALSEMLHRSAGNANKRQLFETILKTGFGEDGRPGETVEGAREIPNAFPKSVDAKTSLYIPAETYGEFRKMLGLDAPAGKLPGMDKITTFSLAGFTHGLTHLKNQITMGYRMGGILGALESVPKFLKYTGEIWSGKPSEKIQDRIIELARIGMMPEKHFGVEQKSGPMRFVSRLLETVDAAQRLTMEDAFHRMVEKGYDIKPTEYNMRNYINQLGQYNKRAQNTWIAWLRDTGLGPFATAAAQYTANSIRGLAGGSSLQTKSGTWGGDIANRARQLSVMTAVLSIAPVMNYLLNGNVMGDENTPIGAVKIGEKENGETRTLDIASWTGLPRGARAVGLMALLEGQRKGSSWSQIGEEAKDQAFGALAHPALGPAVSLGHTIITGKNTLGHNIAPVDVERGRIPEGVPGVGGMMTVPQTGSRVLENVRAGLLQANPLVSSVTGSQRPATEMSSEERIYHAGSAAGLGLHSGTMARQVNVRLMELQNERSVWAQGRGRAGEMYPGEGECRRLQQAHTALQRIDQELRGRARSNGQTVVIEPPSEDRQRELRRLQSQIANQALSQQQ